MDKKAVARGTWIFVLGLILGAGVHLFGRFSDDYFLSSVLFPLLQCLYVGLVLFWAQSLYSRLLPSPLRRSLVQIALLLILLLVLGVMRHRLIPQPGLWSQFTWYGYYVPFLLIPTLFLTVAIRLQPERSGDRLLPALALLIALLLVAAVMTNDRHLLVFPPAAGDLSVTPNDHGFGPLYWALAAWMVLSALLGFLLLLRARRLRQGLRGLIVPCLELAGAGLSIWIYVQMSKLPKPYELPELFMIITIVVAETCIRSGLIPSNENYEGFYAGMRLPGLICDLSLRPVYRAAPMDAGPGILAKALEGPWYPEPDTRLCAEALPGGWVFWAEDESLLHRMRRELEKANEGLAEENQVILAENRLREEKTRMEARNRIYNQIAQELRPTQEKLAALLEKARPGTPEFRPLMAQCCLLAAYYKRRSNLILLADAGLPEENRELYLALDESCRYLSFCGVPAAVLGERSSRLPLERICGLYDRFEDLTEALLPGLRGLTVSLTESGLRLCARLEGEPPAGDWRESEGLWYLDLSGAEASV